MQLLPIFYAGAYLLVACAGYLLCKVVPRWSGAALSAFVALLAFGACSYVGFITIVLAIGVSPFKGLILGTPQRFTYAVAYVLPGILGIWLALKAFQAMSPSRKLP
jgi:hypothetical protein